MVAINVLWFRHGLRLHDNPALLEAIDSHKEPAPIQILPVFIFDGESAGTKTVGYNRIKFLLDSLIDLDNQFRSHGGRLYMFRGNPVHIFRRLWEEYHINGIYFEQDCEPIWGDRDLAVESLCNELGIKFVERVSHTLWDPYEVIKANGGIPPLTYQMFLHTVQTLGPPARPVAAPMWERIHFSRLANTISQELKAFERQPIPEDFDIYSENTGSVALAKWPGGETYALINLNRRLRVEECAFRQGFYLPNQAHPDILNTSTSMSPYLRFGCLSVRHFYWAVHDVLKQVQRTHNFAFPDGPHITGQLIWREYFYTMSVKNPFYGQMEGNDICLSIPWSVPKSDELERWKYGRTGYPLIDAAMRQLLCEGWLHHILRNTVASFLTRGGLWLSWEFGLEHFLKYLLDADWSVCAGNWMWVSSSAFEKLLDTSKCTCPISLARRLDPNGEYIYRYVPELRVMPKEYIHEPWTAPEHVQESVGCVVGIHYPSRMIDINKASAKNQMAMKVLRESLIAEGAPKEGPPHCRPSNEEEIRQFFWLHCE